MQLWLWQSILGLCSWNYRMIKGFRMKIKVYNKMELEVVVHKSFKSQGEIYSYLETLNLGTLQRYALF
jgi:hypothetical protein